MRSTLWCLNSSPRQNPARGFTLIELMTVVVIVGVLATLGAVMMRKHMDEAKKVEALAMMQSIRSAQENWRAENQSYLNVSQNGWYPRDPAGADGATKQSFFYPGTSDTHADNDRWLQLNPLAPGPVRYGYRTNAGLPGETMTAPIVPITGFTWPTNNEPWYVIQVIGDVDADGSTSFFITSSMNGEVFSRDEAE